MQDSVYNALFGSLNQEHKLNIISNNLANVNTSGFKKQALSFEQVLDHFAHDFADPHQSLRGGVLWPEADQMSQPRISESRTVFQQGAVKQTGNALDLALMGEGFFKVQTPEGQRFTRNGHFSLSAEGAIVDSHGNELLGDSGPMRVPPQAHISITPDGGLAVNGEGVGQISVSTVSDLNALEKVGNNLYQLPEDSDAREIQADDAEVVQGALEQSNVNAVVEMVRMIETLRTFEACQKIMSSSNDQESRMINKLGNPS